MDNDFKVVVEFLDPLHHYVASEETTFQNFILGGFVTYKKNMYQIENIHVNFDELTVYVIACDTRWPK